MTEDLSFGLRRSLQMASESEDRGKAAFHAAVERQSTPCPSCGKPIRHRKGLEWCQDHEMAEKTLQDRIRDRAKRRGWTVMHVAKAIAAFDEQGNKVWITPAEPGWPDLFLVNPRATPYKAIAMELKKEDGVLGDDQVRWLGLLNASGIPAVIIRPSDLREGRVNAILEGR